MREQPLKPLHQRFNHTPPSSLHLPDLHNKARLASRHFASTRWLLPNISSFLPPCGFFKYVAAWERQLRVEIFEIFEIFAPFNCYLDILLALRNYSWISGLPLIEATNLLREETNRVPAQQAHTLISLTNSVPLYHSDNFYIQRLKRYICDLT